jgi:membrane carboxypeptidase/penicillin-binding protein
MHSSVSRLLQLYDVVLVKVTEARGKGAARAELRVRPQVQGAAVVLENKTGRILAMAGGFSYPLSQLNRTTQAQRQPGSAFKPVTYLAALQKGLQPNTFVRDEEITFAPIGGNDRDQDYWTPKNYDGGASGIVTLRRALEHSKNLATVNLLNGGIDLSPALSLDRICAIAMEAQVYHECVRYYPFVLGAQPVRPIDLAAFYAAIANEGLRPAPYAIESIERNGETVYRHEPTLSRIGSVDAASFYQLKTMLQGVLQHGTAHAIASLAPYVGGKTGTTDGENDGWFVGFTNEVTVAVWVGYDNADGKRRTLGGGQTGASVAIPIFAPIIQAVWADQTPRTPLAGPSPDAKRLLVAVRGDGDGEGGGRGRGGVDYVRRDRNGQPRDSRYVLVPRDEIEVPQEPRDYDGDAGRFQPWGFWGPQQPQQSQQPPARSPYYRAAPRQPPPPSGLFGWQPPWRNDEPRPPPSYFNRY